MICYKLTIAYEGTNYSGWQYQFNASTIQQHIQEALARLLRKEFISIVGSGRTDAGVHAKAQIAHFRHPELVDLNILLLSLNGILPKDIKVLKVEVVPLHFHARYSAIGKEYHYHIYTNRVMDPFRRQYCWHMYRCLDLDLLKEAANLFVGTHDFTSFANESHKGASAKNPVRTIYRLDVIVENDAIRLEFEGNGFLYKMVRNIVGTLIDVASHKKPITFIQTLFEAKDRSLACRAAPAKGLFMQRVIYPDLLTASPSSTLSRLN